MSRYAVAGWGCGAFLQFSSVVMGYLASPIFCTPAQNILEYLAPPVRNILKIFGTPSGKNVPLIELRLARSFFFFFFFCTKKKMACAVRFFDTLNQNLLYIKSLLSHTSYIISISISWTTQTATRIEKQPRTTTAAKTMEKQLKRTRTTTAAKTMEKQPRRTRTYHQTTATTEKTKAERNQ